MQPDTNTPTPPPTTQPPTTPGADGQRVTSIRVIDGDTIETAEFPNGIRILGYDTPERGECGYAEATDRLRQLVTGNIVTVTTDAGDDKDHYGRSLRHVLVNGTPVGLRLIREGLAHARYDSLDGYARHRYQNLYRDADAATPHLCDTGGGGGSTGGTTYANCDAVRAAGKAPIYRGQPGYGSHLDRDGDGIGCE